MCVAAASPAGTFASFDIDDFLAYQEYDVLAPFAARRSGFIKTAQHIHYLVPGAIELVRLVHHELDGRIGFWSAGPNERNLSFVNKLLKIALSPHDYRAINGRVSVLSRDALTKISPDDQRKQREQYGIGKEGKHYFKKDLSLHKQPLEHVVHFDDRCEVMLPGQERNLLLVDSVNSFKVYATLQESRLYSPQGYRETGSVICLPKHIDKSYINAKVRKDHDIYLQKTAEGIHLHFYHQDQECVTTETIDEAHPLYKHVKVLSLDAFSIRILIVDKKLLKVIKEYAVSKGGTTLSFCYHLNTLCYAAGAFMLALESARREGTPITQKLKRFQFKKIKGTSQYAPTFEIRQQCDMIYRKGLESLRRYNPNYTYITPYTLSLCMRTPLDENETEKMERAIKLLTYVETAL
jgi:hypothetical protein